MLHCYITRSESDLEIIVSTGNPDEMQDWFDWVFWYWWFSGSEGSRFKPAHRSRPVCVALVFSPCLQLLRLPPIRDSKLPVGGNVSVNGCLSRYVNPVICWRPVQGVLRLLPNVSWDWLQAPDPLKIMDFIWFCDFVTSTSSTTGAPEVPCGVSFLLKHRIHD